MTFTKLKTRTIFGIVEGIHFLFIFKTKIDLFATSWRSIFRENTCLFEKNRKWIPPTIPNDVLVFSFMKIIQSSILKLKSILLGENRKLDTPKNPKNRPFLLKKWFHEIEINADFWDSWACPVFYFPPKICFYFPPKHIFLFLEVNQKEGRLVGFFGVFSFFFFPKKLLF